VPEGYTTDSTWSISFDIADTLLRLVMSIRRVYIGALAYSS